MRRQLSWAFCLVVVGAGASHADNEKKPDAPKPNEVEVRFGDGSKVRMLLLQESVEIVTRYGKLAVPTSDIRGIDLGVHLPDGTQEKIDAALKRLSSPSFKERDAAVNDLVALGGHAYPALLRAAKTSELEVAQRVQAAIKRIQAKLTPDLLRTSTNDRVITTDFPISGRIVSPTLRAKTPYFGELALKLPELRSIRWLSGNIDSAMTIEAAKYANNAQWLDTGVTVDGSAGLTITAAGEVDLMNDGSGDFVTGPGGTRNIGRRGAGGRLPGALIGKIGDGGPIFLIGERYQAFSTPAGKLFLQIVPPPFNNGQVPSGSYKVSIRAGYFFEGR